MTKIDDIIKRIQTATNDINSGVDVLAEKLNNQSNASTDEVAKVREELDSVINELEGILGENNGN